MTRPLLHARQGWRRFPPRCSRLVAGLLLALGSFRPLPACAEPLPTPNAVPASNHWAFRPMRAVAPPVVRNPAWTRNAIDRFVLARLEERGLAPAARADRRTLLRRVTYDLTGLPPAPADVEAFLSDASGDAFRRAVERLLGSRQYGEQWGRHWLDLVRYADTAGENTDHPVPQAWRYRNWVIAAFNRDLPYDEFLRDQIAGDLRAQAGAPEEYADRIVATGFLAIARRFGHDIDKDMHLTHEDTIDTLGKSMLGLTLGCARCHDHKYDPISSRDYYALYGIFQSTRFAFPGCEPKQQPRDLVPLVPAAELERLRQPFAAEQARREAEVKRCEDELAAARRVHSNAPPAWVVAGNIPRDGRQEFAAGSNAVVLQHLAVRQGQMLQLSVLPQANHGADSTLIEFEIAEQGGAGRVWNFTRDVLDDFYEHGEGARHRDGYGRPNVWHLFDLAPVPSLFTQFVRDAENTPGLQVWRGSEGVPSVFVNTNAHPIKFITITMPARAAGVHPGPKGGVAVGWQSPINGTVSVRGRVAKIDPGGDGIAWRLEPQAELGALLAAQQPIAAALAEAKARREAHRKLAPIIPVAYAVTEGKAQNAPLQQRGDPEKPGELVPRRWLEWFGGDRVRGTNDSGRRELAEWVTRRDNPLTARVMANRIWQYHFGRGLVATPNDFGLRGQPPTHPELLDWLATELVRSGWSVKALHRLILDSATYQSAGAGANPAGIDPDQKDPAASGRAAELYAVFPRRRLSAEELRDTLLAVSGDLDTTPGQGHPFPPEDKWSFTQHTPFASEYESNRRSVYLMQKRNRRTPFFALFDGADPNASTPVRDNTTVPTQALFFMNDPFAHACARKFAARIAAASANDRDRLDFAFRTLLGRKATAEEQADAADFLSAYARACGENPAGPPSLSGWQAYARVLFASNELLYLD